jgi:Ras-specific guanine nucleotide-releasing factor RalGPS
MERSDYKREPCKVCSLEGWSAEAIEHSQQSNTFQLTNMEMGTAYKFRTGSAEMSRQWLKAIRRISSTTEHHQRVPANLMSFE